MINFLKFISTYKNNFIKIIIVFGLFLIIGVLIDVVLDIS